MYYKTVPPSMFVKPFTPNPYKAPPQVDKDKMEEQQITKIVGIDLKTIKVDGYVAQEIARDHLEIV